MVGDLLDLVLLTGLSEGRGPSLRAILAVHLAGATVGCALGLLVGFGVWPLAGGALAAAVLGAQSAVLLGGAPAAAALVAAFVELTTYCNVRLVLWVHHQVLA